MRKKSSSKKSMKSEATKSGGVPAPPLKVRKEDLGVEVKSEIARRIENCQDSLKSIHEQRVAKRWVVELVCERGLEWLEEEIKRLEVEKDESKAA